MQSLLFKSEPFEGFCRPFSGLSFQVFRSSFLKFWVQYVSNSQFCVEISFQDCTVFVLDKIFLEFVSRRVGSLSFRVCVIQEFPWFVEFVVSVLVNYVGGIFD